MTRRKEAFENILGKGENSVNQHFLLFPNVSYHSQNKFNFSVAHILSSESAWNLDWSKIFWFRKELKLRFVKE